MSPRLVMKRLQSHCQARRTTQPNTNPPELPIFTTIRNKFKSSWPISSRHFVLLCYYFLFWPHIDPILLRAVTINIQVFSLARQFFMCLRDTLESMVAIRSAHHLSGVLSFSAGSISTNITPNETIDHHHPVQRVLLLQWVSHPIPTWKIQWDASTCMSDK